MQIIVVLVAVDLEGVALKIDRHVLSARVDFLEQVLKSILNLGVCHGRCFNEFHIAVLLTQLLGFLLRYLSGTRILFHHVNLIANKHDANVLLSRVEERLQPVFHIVECLAIGHVVHYQAAESFSVMSHCNRPVLFLTSSVPKLGLDGRSVLHSNVLSGELDADCRALCLRQGVLEVSTH